MHKSKFTLIVLSSLLLLVVSTAFAGPKITKVKLGLGQKVADGYYVVAPDTSDPWGMEDSKTLKGIWINPGAASGDEDTSLTGTAKALELMGTVDVSVAAMLNAGNKHVYPAILISLPNNTVEIGKELLELLDKENLNYNPVISKNPDIAQIPTNINNIDLSRAIPAGTEVTFTVDMDGELPHVLAVMGGVNPDVTYDATGNGTLTITTTTFATTNAAGQPLDSIVGFMLVTNQQGGTEPLRIIIQTNIWGGDVLEFPAMTTDGAMGTVNTMLGLTAYGPVGESRNINVFFPDDAIDPVFGSGSNFQPSNLAMFFDSEQQNSGSVTLEYGVSKDGVVGTEASASYTFSASGRAGRSDSSEKNVSIGIRSDAEVSVLKDLDGDRKAGLAEVIYILQTLTEFEPSEEKR